MRIVDASQLADLLPPDFNARWVRDNMTLLGGFHLGRRPVFDLDVTERLIGEIRDAECASRDTFVVTRHSVPDSVLRDVVKARSLSGPSTLPPSSRRRSANYGR